VGFPPSRPFLPDESRIVSSTPPRARLSHEEPDAGKLHIRVCDLRARVFQFLDLAKEINCRSPNWRQKDLQRVKALFSK
jgi:hypothetical protein